MCGLLHVACISAATGFFGKTKKCKNVSVVHTKTRLGFNAASLLETRTRCVVPAELVISGCRTPRRELEFRSKVVTFGARMERARKLTAGCLSCTNSKGISESNVREVIACRAG